MGATGGDKYLSGILFLYQVCVQNSVFLNTVGNFLGVVSIQHRTHQAGFCFFSGLCF